MSNENDEAEITSLRATKQVRNALKARAAASGMTLFDYTAALLEDHLSVVEAPPASSGAFNQRHRGSTTGARR